MTAGAAPAANQPLFQLAVWAFFLPMIDILVYWDGKEHNYFSSISDCFINRLGQITCATMPWSFTCPAHLIVLEETMARSHWFPAKERSWFYFQLLGQQIKASRNTTFSPPPSSPREGRLLFAGLGCSSFLQVRETVSALFHEDLLEQFKTLN